MLQPLRFYQISDVSDQIRAFEHIDPETWSQHLMTSSEGKTYFIPHFNLLKDFFMQLDLSLLPSSFTIAHVSTIKHLLEDKFLKNFLSQEATHLSSTVGISPQEVLNRPEEWKAILQSLGTYEAEDFLAFLAKLKNSITILPAFFTLEKLLAYQKLFDHILLKNGLLFSMIDLNTLPSSFTPSKIKEYQHFMEKSWFHDTVLAKALSNYAEILQSSEESLNFSLIWSSLSEINSGKIPFFSNKNGKFFTLNSKNKENEALQLVFHNLRTGNRNQDITRVIDASSFHCHQALIALLLHTNSFYATQNFEAQAKLSELHKNIKEFLQDMYEIKNYSLKDLNESLRNRNRRVKTLERLDIIVKVIISLGSAVNVPYHPTLWIAVLWGVPTILLKFGKTVGFVPALLSILFGTEILYRQLNSNFLANEQNKFLLRHFVLCQIPVTLSLFNEFVILNVLRWAVRKDTSDLAATDIWLKTHIEFLEETRNIFNFGKEEINEARPRIA